MSEHPSSFDLDVVALGGALGAEQQAHVGACAACSAYLEARTMCMVIPASLEQRLQPRMTRYWAFGFALAAAAAALVLVVQDESTVRGKAARPEVTVHIKDGKGNVHPWDGKSPIAPGDSLRLELFPLHYSYATVISPGSDGAKVLHAGALDGRNDHGGVLLPVSWKVDADGGDEQIAVIFSTHALTPAEIDAALTRGSDAVVHHTLHKRAE